ncbi:MAG: thiamine pyrophosphate-dependent enzyme [Sulfurimonas sp.]|nr:thiamine pyrophosphate-dependent enzyme [Sulfurimonas sp.]MDD5203469.1 thiamine pyrophosphate-dependent enzyme [Sulfurimonas sp.]
MSHLFDRENVDVAWCPGCGNFGILKLIKEVLEELKVEKNNTVIVSGIGQAAKTPYYVDTNMFGVLHGRALPAATGIKMANPELMVIAEGGDGDMYGEGGNHFIHTIRRNVNIVHIVHNNMVYGLTKGQASPTSQKGFETKVQVNGVINEPFNPLAVALSLRAGFVSRVNIGNAEHAKGVLKAAFMHHGYALVDIFQPCVIFNKTNTYQWFKDNTYALDENHDSNDFNAALQKAFEVMPMPLGVLYQNKNSVVTFEEQIRKSDAKSLYFITHDVSRLQNLFDSY